MKNSKWNSGGIFVELLIGYDHKEISDWSEEGLINNPNVVSAYYSYKATSPMTNTTYYIFNGRKVK